MTTGTALPTAFPDVLQWLRARRDVSIVQIGAYVGATDNDPLCGYLTHAFRAGRPADASVAVLVEPVGEYFARLRAAYAGLPGVRFEHAAIAETSEPRDFHRLAVDPVAHGHPEWLAQLGSLRPERMTRLWDGYERGHLPDESAALTRFYRHHQVVERVPCLTFADLLARHALDAIDLLQIDTEGYDYAILRTIDFARVRPAFVNYERVLLQEDEPACRRLMLEAGYTLTDWGQDTLCTRVDAPLSAWAAAPLGSSPRP